MFTGAHRQPVASGVASSQSPESHPAAKPPSELDRWPSSRVMWLSISPMPPARQRCGRTVAVAGGAPPSDLASVAGAPKRGRVPLVFPLPAAVATSGDSGQGKTPSERGFLESPLPDSNRRPLPYHGSALPAELRGRKGLLSAPLAHPVRGSWPPELQHCTRGLRPRQPHRFTTSDAESLVRMSSPV
jgi:hypothetical protein